MSEHHPPGPNGLALGPDSKEEELSTPDLELPVPSAVGVLEPGLGRSDRPRVYSRGQKMFASAFLLFFLIITVLTSALSLGAYCLSTEGADTRSLRSSPFWAPESE